MIPLSKPTYDEQTKKELLEVLDSGWTGNGSKVLEFEKQFAEYVGAKYAVACNSATSALDICIKAYDITDGELITTPLTFVADASVGEFNGMDVTFADIDPETLCIDVNTINITPETKVIIAVDSHGRLADYKGIKDKLKELEREDILVIEDAAHAMYTPKAGTIADLCVYSFQAVKTLPIFDGGMITTNDEKIAKKLKTLMWLGIEKTTFDRVGKGGYVWDYEIDHSGIKGYMTDVQAVIGLGQLRRLEKMNIKRRAYQDELPDQIEFSGTVDSGGNNLFSSSLEDDADDDLYEDARQIIIETGKASTSYLQRKLGVGYARAAKLIDMLEERGVVGASNGSKPRDVLEKPVDHIGTM